MLKHNRYILGTGGMAREVYSIYNDLGVSDTVKGFIVQKKHKTSESLYNLPVYSDEKIRNFLGDSVFIGGMGSPLRANWIRAIEKAGGKFETLIHPSSQIGENTKIERGCIIMPGVVLTTDILVKSHTIINSAVSIGHDTKVGSFVSISPGAHIGGYVHIGDESFIGIGAVVKNNITIGKSSFIGAGAVVVDDIPDNSLAYGNPCRVVRKISTKDWENLL